MEAEIIAPIPKDVLKAELTDDKRLRMTSKSNNEVYVVTWQDSPNVVREIGRLREIAFRAAGGGTGLDCDLDGSTLWTILTSNLSYGILKPTRLSADTDTSWAQTYNLTKKDNRYWPPATCSISPTTSSKTTCLIP